MKNKTLHIENFGPIRDADVQLRSLNLFIGQQAIGKSTLAKLITIFTDYISLCKLIHGGALIWETLLKEYGLDVYKEDPYQIAFDMYEDNRKFSMKVIKGKVSCSMTVDGKMITNRDYISDRMVDLMKIFHSVELSNKVASGKKSGKKTEEILDLFTNSLYIPAERIIYSVLTNIMPALALASSSVPKTLLRFMVDLTNAKNEYPNFPIDLLNVLFKFESGEDSIVVAGEKKTIPLTVASSGIQSLVPLVLVLQYAIEQREYSSFVIEEPECNLFPTKQVALLKEILRLVKAPRILTITTHSPYLLSAMNNILFAGMIVAKYGESAKKRIEEIIPAASLLNAEDCSVYSLGADINDGIYCRSLIDEETGMIDFNSLDCVSEGLSEEFDELQNVFMDVISEK